MSPSRVAGRARAPGSPSTPRPPPSERSSDPARPRLTSPERTLRDLPRPRPRAGRVRAGHVLGLVADRDAGRTITRSEAERRMLALIRAAGLPRPRVNTPLGPYEVDLHWPAERLVVEIDGYAFHSSRAAFERDRLRDADLQARGRRVLRITYRRLTTAPEAVVAALAAALRRARPSDRAHAEWRRLPTSVPYPGGPRIAPRRRRRPRRGRDRVARSAPSPACIGARTGKEEHRAMVTETVHGLFLRTAAEMSSQVAVEQDGERLTYAELERRSAWVAAGLARGGVRSGDLVGIAMTRSPALIAALLGILRAGAAYVPLDTAYPAPPARHGGDRRGADRGPHGPAHPRRAGAGARRRRRARRRPPRRGPRGRRARAGRVGPSPPGMPPCGPTSSSPPARPAGPRASR